MNILQEENTALLDQIRQLQEDGKTSHDIFQIMQEE